MSDEMKVLTPAEFDDMQSRLLDMAHREAGALRTAGLHGSATEHMRRALVEAADARARALRPATPAAPPPPPVPVPTAPPVAPVPAPAVASAPPPPEPAEPRTLGEAMIQRALAARAARPAAGNPALDMSQPMGLRPRR